MVNKRFIFHSISNLFCIYSIYKCLNFLFTIFRLGILPVKIVSDQVKLILISERHEFFFKKQNSDFLSQKTVTRSYYRGAAGALLVYDTTSRDSFNALSAWLNDARTLASPNIVILLVGNKRDLEEARAVTLLEASNFAQENELIFLETSAKTGDNVEEAFLRCSKSILAKIECGELDPERTGSGIQYGDAALRNIQLKQRNSTGTRPSDCRCGL